MQKPASFYSLAFVLGLGLAVSNAHAQQNTNVRRAAPPVKSVSASPVPARPLAFEGNVVFRANDSFELRLSGMLPKEALPFAEQFTIDRDGYINVPLGGQVRALGLTQSQLERAIERCLIEKKIFTRPTATINVAPQARFVTIGGQVRNPQRLP